MVFVTVGTQPNGFLRCLREVDNLVSQKIIDEEVVAQIGNTDFTTENFETLKFCKESEFKDYVANADVVITHAGSGAIFSAIKAGKKIIAMARLHEYNEMADNHQTELVRKLSEEGYLIDGTHSLKDAWEKVETFLPRGNDFMCKIVDALDKYISEQINK